MFAHAARRTGLTPRQRCCLDAIKAHERATGAMPSISELQTSLGVRSKTAVHRLLVQLEARGAIKRKAGKSRAIRLASAACPHCGGELQ
jgi:repressor LexA